MIRRGCLKRTLSFFIHYSSHSSFVLIKENFQTLLVLQKQILVRGESFAFTVVRTFTGSKFCISTKVGICSLSDLNRLRKRKLVNKTTFVDSARENL